MTQDAPSSYTRTFGTVMDRKMDMLSIRPTLKRKPKFTNTVQQTDTVDPRHTPWATGLTNCEAPRSPMSTRSKSSPSSKNLSRQPSILSSAMFSRTIVSTLPSTPVLSTPQSWHYFIPSMPCTKDFDDLTMYLVLSKEVQAAIRSLRGTQQQSHNQSLGHQSLSPPSLFRSICLCSPSTKGHPIHSRSRHFTIGPRSLKIGDRQFLNLPSAQQSGTFNLTCRQGSDGRPQFVLEYAAGMLRKEDGEVEWVLAAQMDVTEMMRSLTACMIAEGRRKKELVQESDGLVWDDTSDETSSPSSSSTSSDDRSTSTAATGLSLHANHTFLKEEVQNSGPVDWLSIATSPPQFPRTPDSLLPASALNNFRHTLSHLHAIHHHTLLLSRLPNLPIWHITHTSLALDHNPEDIAVGFSSHSERKLQRELSEEAPRPMELEVRWGMEEVWRLMYCVPMFGAGLEGWVCFLVDEKVEGWWSA